MQAGFPADLAALYPDLDASFLQDAGAGFEPVRIAGGEALVRMGDDSDALYILMRGRLVATRTDDEGNTVRLGEIGRGEIIGEMSVLTGARRTATVTALRDSQLVRMPKDAFLRFMQHHPSVLRQFVQILIHRLGDRTPGRREKLATIALVPAGEAAAVVPFARSLVAALATHVSTRLIDRDSVRRQFPGGLDEANETQAAGWLNDLELEHGVLVYACDTTADRWTQLCLRQADRVLLVARTGDVPTPNRIEAQLHAGEAIPTLRGCELVLLHPADGGLPRDSDRWLAGRRLRRHHHLRSGCDADLQRLCRHLLGRSVGLVLGGGGAKALAEIGVLRAFEASGVPVDVIGGTSMGAVIGALAAHGRCADDVHATLRDALKLRPFSGVTLPVVSLLSGRRLARTMQFLFGDVRIEDLWRRYFCVSCNLTRGAVDTRSRGELAKWVTASNAIPGIVPPVLEHGELYVDGGLLNNLPADAMATLNAGPVVAVNVSSVAEMKAGVPDDTDLSGWSLLFDGLRANASRGRIPRLGRILVRSMLLASSNHSQAMRAHAALYLTPPVKGVDPNDWHALDTLVESGYRYTMEALERWDDRPQTGL
jgi:predicted acylesterase/phospholipase RssA/CRP-like cAMP-binding protein